MPLRELRKSWREQSTILLHRIRHLLRRIHLLLLLLYLHKRGVGLSIAIVAIKPKIVKRKSVKKYNFLINTFQRLNARYVMSKVHDHFRIEVASRVSLTDLVRRQPKGHNKKINIKDRSFFSPSVCEPFPSFEQANRWIIIKDRERTNKFTC